MSTQKENNNFMQKNKGYLILIGGKEDKTGEKTILKETISISRAKKLVIIPAATSYPVKTSRKYFNVFSELGVKNVKILDIRYSHEADSDANIKIIEEADLIFFPGGDQERLAEILVGTKLLQSIKNRHLNGLSIAGTSAGAAAVSNPMIFDGTTNGFNKGSVLHAEGFDLLHGVTIDTHFIKRGRIARLSQFLTGGLSDFGIGLAEDTGIIISPDNTFKVIGSGAVSILSSKSMCYTNFQEINNNEHITTDGLQISFLFNGIVYDINKREIINSDITKKNKY